MTEPWLDLRIVLLILHIFGTIIGAGAAFTGDLIFLTSVRSRILTTDGIRTFKITSIFVWVGLVVASLSGIGLVLQRPEIFLQSEKLWAKITILGVIIINGLVFHLVHRPVFARSAGKKFTKSTEIIKKRKWILISGAISVVSWSTVIILGVLGKTPFTYIHFVGLYMGILIMSCGSALLLRKILLSPEK